MPGQMPCGNAASAGASRPSFRMRITEGPRSPLIAGREWKSASSVMQTRASVRARRRMSASSARLIPISETWITSQPACASSTAVDRGKPCSSSRRFTWFRAVARFRPGCARRIPAPGGYLAVPVQDTRGADRPNSDRPRALRAPSGPTGMPRMVGRPLRTVGMQVIRSNVAMGFALEFSPATIIASAEAMNCAGILGIAGTATELSEQWLACPVY